MDSNSEIVGYSFGAFDLLHIGHIYQLERAKFMCDFLIVGVFTDAAVESFKRQPIIPAAQRLEIVRSLSCVDMAVLQEARDPTCRLKMFKPDILFHGDDWEEIPGADYVKAYGGKVVTPPYYREQSTSKIIQTILGRHCEKDCCNSCCGVEGRGAIDSICGLP